MDAGDVLELDSREGDPVDVYVDGRLYARGEAVVVDGHLAVRVCERTGARDEAPQEPARTP